PLYLYPEITGLTSKDQNTNRKPNLNKEIVQKIADKLGLKFTDEKDVSASSTSTSSTSEGTFAPIDILDYIYAVLHCPSYRAKYKEFLKIDFPRVPYPENAETFWQSVKFGSELRLFHLLEHPKTAQFITTYPKAGSNMVVKIRYESGKVNINEEQYFDKVPLIAWEFYIGGYQPAQKWLKDRKGRLLTVEDIEHYQKIIVALTETDLIMKEIDGIFS
ncbi:MAG: DNA methyltransferase, partial [Desulfobacteraceae bacterium IS3]